jgi:hypothetical protein
MEVIDRVLFRAKHWEMFLIFVAMSFVDTMIGGNPRGGIFLVLYLMILGVRLRSFLPSNFQGDYRLFRVAGVLVIATLVYMVGFQTFEPSPVMLVFVLAILVMYFILLSFVSKGIVSIETGDASISFPDYFADFLLLMFFFPIGVWFIQPRLNKIGDRFSL